jgi:hypothetical protein
MFLVSKLLPYFSTKFEQVAAPPLANLFIVAAFGVNRLGWILHIILDENKQVRQVLEKFPNIRIIEQFEPPDRMFHDDVHLNNYGISAIVNHLKIALNLSPPFMSKRRKSGQGRRSDVPQRENTFRP